jgi:hypothetical protein
MSQCSLIFGKEIAIADPYFLLNCVLKMKIYVKYQNKSIVINKWPYSPYLIIRFLL